MQKLLVFIICCCASLSAQLSWTDYSFKPRSGAPVKAEIARFGVPEFHNQASGQTIRLAVVRLKSTAQKPAAAPIVFLTGGPGGSGISQAGEDAFIGAITQLRSVADVLLLDQRGTGLAEPNLECPGEVNLPLDEAPSRESWMKMTQEFVQNCKAAIKKRGVDLNAYNTEESADDVESLRKALGVSKVQLFGFSYGSHLALSVIRRHPDSVQAAILAGVEGPDHTVKLPSKNATFLAEMSEQIVKDPYWKEKLPDFRGSLQQGLKLLEKPMVVDVKNPRTGAPAKVAISSLDVQMSMVDQLGKKGSLEFWPGAVYRLAKGDFGNIGTLTFMFRSSPRKVTAMTFGMDCASSGSDARLAQVEKEGSASPLGDVLDFPLQQSCEFWGVKKLPESFRASITSSVPTLFISGTIDGRTPPSNTAELLSGFKNGKHMVVENASHTDLVSYPAVQKAMVGFLNSEATPERVTAPALVFKRLEEMKF